MSDETSNQPQKNGGKGKLRGKDNPKPFTSTYQPGAKKSAATRKAQADMRKGLRALLNSKYKFKDGSALYQQLVTAFGPDVKNRSAVELMILQQLQKAIMQGDTYAFSTVMNQLLGMPKQEIEGNVAGNLPAVMVQMPAGVSLNFPENTDGEE